MKKLGKFEIIEKVGQGAMGVVYKARDPLIDRIVALKTITTGLAEDPNLLKRFYSEARSAGGLQHPNIVTIYELGHEGSTPFIAMQFLTGESLDKIIERRPNLPLAQRIGFVVYVCRALEYAHKQNPPLVHRDIKPGNVMVTQEGAVMVVDFGIARLGEGTRSQSAGMLIGTLGYMSPQLFRNSAADARSDIWATGVMFYELLGYKRPFDGDNAAALMSSIILDRHRPLSEFVPDVPADVQAVVDRMLAKEIETRYQTMEEVLMELEPIWQRLRQAEVSRMLANSQELLDAGDLENAKAAVGQIIKIDTSNTHAKSLLERINAEVRRKQIVPQIKARVEKAEKLLANGQVEEAKAELDVVHKLDSTFQPARELRAQVEAAEQRARKIAEALRASKQRMAEGAITEAELQLDKVLEIDPGNAAAREQLKVIKEERSRRERRKQRDVTLHRARTLWTNLQYDECINLLVEGLKQFPGDAEITKLLDSARQDQAEQQRQSILTDARNLLSAQKFDEALHVLDELLERFPSDVAAKNLRIHAQQGRDQRARDQQLVEAKIKLRAWLKEARYEDVLKYAAQFSREFPDDFELIELIDYARTEQSQLEQKRRLDGFLERIRLAMKDARFSEAVQAAEKGLLEFPKNLDLIIQYESAKQKKAEKEKHEELKQRLREVERLMESQQLTDAIDLARQTLATIGQDPRIADTLLKAEKELEFRERQKQKQSDAVKQARTLMNSGKLSEATSILHGALETQLLARNDPQVTQLLSEIAARKEPPPPPPAPKPSVAEPSPAPFGSAISSKPTADPAKDYVYQRGTPLPEDLRTPDSEVIAAASSPTMITGPTVQPVAPPPVVQPRPEKKEKKQSPREGLPSMNLPSSGQVDATSFFSSAPAAEPVAEPSNIFAPPVEVEKPQVEKRRDKVKPGPEEPVQPSLDPHPRPFWKNPLVIGGMAAVLVLIAIVGYLVIRPSQSGNDHPGTEHPNPPPGVLTTEDKALLDSAAQFMSMNPQHLAEALAKYQAFISTGKDTNGNAKQQVEKIQSLQKQENDWMDKGAQAQQAKRYDEALKDYDQAKRINGDREKDAEAALDTVNKLKAGKDPAELAQANFSQAETLFAQKQWARAKSLYEQVINFPQAPAKLRADATQRLNQIDEEGLWTQAQTAYSQSQLATAKQLAQRVVEKHLNHQTEAQSLIGKIDAELGADSEFNDLRQRVDAAKSNKTELENLQTKARSIASGNGRHAAEARNIAEKEIPDAIKAIDANTKGAANAARVQQLTNEARGLAQSGHYRDALNRTNEFGQLGADPNPLRQEIQNAEKQAFQGLQNDYRNADKKNESALKTFQTKVQQFKDNASNSQDSQSLLDTIATDIAATKTVPVVDEKPAIKAVLEQLSSAFGTKKTEELKKVWLLPKNQETALKAAFGASKSVSRNFVPADITVNGDGAVAKGTWSGVFDTGGSSPSSGPFTATLKKQGGRWVITDLVM